MAKETCASCNGPREPDSSSYSYCKACAKKKQRTRYRNTREAAGLIVKPRVEDDLTANDRYYWLKAQSNQPGTCECCSQPSPSLILEHYSTSNPPDPNDMTGVPLAVWCSECHKLAQSLTSDELRRAVLIFQYLARTKVQHSALLKDLVWPDNSTDNGANKKETGAI